MDGGLRVIEMAGRVAQRVGNVVGAVTLNLVEPQSIEEQAGVERASGELTANSGDVAATGPFTEIV
jgi:hypothetical protein